MRARPAPGLAALAAAALAAAGCAALPLPRHAVASCPGPLRPTVEIEGEFLLRQRLRVVLATRELALDLAVEKRGDRLVLLGFDAFGGNVLSMTQTGVETRDASLPPPALELPPENVLSDLHRARFLALAAPPGGEGETAGTLAGLRIREGWSAGSPRWRSLAPVAGGPLVRVELGPGRARVENPACGYSATLVTLEERALPAGRRP
jgi:hypothetical protein